MQWGFIVPCDAREIARQESRNFFYKLNRRLKFVPDTRYALADRTGLRTDGLPHAPEKSFRTDQFDYDPRSNVVYMGILRNRPPILGIKRKARHIATVTVGRVSYETEEIPSRASVDIGVYGAENLPHLKWNPK